MARCVIVVALLPAWVAAQDCTPPSAGPDLIVGDIASIVKWGTVDEITGYSCSTVSFNIGSEPVSFEPTTTDHPLIAQQMYRLANGRMEQIGMSWAKHGFGANTDSTCCPCEDPENIVLLGTWCGDVYSASTNGSQGGFAGGTRGGLGPRSDIRPHDVTFSYPYPFQGERGDDIYKRLQIANSDLDPAMNVDARYFIEVQYLVPDDFRSGNDLNNVSYREVRVDDFFDGGWRMAVIDFVHRQRPAIAAWADLDDAVTLEAVDVTDDGRLILAHRASENTDGTWRYDYAIYNMNASNAAIALRIPAAAAGVTGAGFKDIDYHSGEIHDSTDWTVGGTPDAIEWSAVPTGDDTTINAVRWGTSYNFWFDSAGAPGTAVATIELLDGRAVTVDVRAPGGSDRNTAYDSQDPISFNTVCPGLITDSDEDGVTDEFDDCPDTFSGAEVNRSGCAANQLDDDRDGVANSLDACPRTAAQAAVDETGCAIGVASCGSGSEVLAMVPLLTLALVGARRRHVHT